MRKNYRVLFITLNNVWRYGNIGIDQLTGYLREQGFNIDIQYYSNKYPVNEIIKTIDMTYDLYGFSVNNSNYQKCCEIAKIIKTSNSDAVIDFGGGFPTRYYREIARDSNYIDYMVLGDGEIPTAYLLDVLSKNKEEGRNDKVFHESIATKIDLEGKKDFFNSVITWNPAYDYYEYDSAFRNSRKVHCIQIKNNICTGNCSFCTERHGKIVYKDIDNIVNQIEYVSKQFGVKKIYFTDDNLLDPNNKEAKERVIHLCNKLKKRKLRLTYQCYIKAISVKDTDYDNALLKLMHEVGFVEIFVGIEAGNNEDLELYNKYTTVKNNYEVIRLLKKHGIFPIIGFIAFNPYSSKERITANFKFLCDIECTYLSNYLYSFVVINKYTSLYEKIKKDGLLLDDGNCYMDVKYKYINDDIVPIMDYVRNEMLPKLAQIQYDLDWVTYSMLEHEKCFDNLKDYSVILNQFKKKNMEVIKKYLSILFIEYNLEKFKMYESEFWSCFFEEERKLKEIYDYYISLHIL